jgi:hypothetical protein
MMVPKENKSKPIGNANASAARSTSQTENSYAKVVQEAAGVTL